MRIIDFQDGGHLAWRQSWISDRDNFSFFDLQVTPKHPTMVQVNWPFGSGEAVKNRLFNMAAMVAILDF